MSDENAAPVPSYRTEIADDFISLYANNVLLEGNAWDLRIKFGRVESPTGNETLVKWHAEISIPWAQAKLALYWLRLQVEAMEIQAGKIAIRKDILPIEPPTLSPEDVDNPDAIRMYEFSKKAHAEFIANL
jgi:hypothetical protein